MEIRLAVKDIQPDSIVDGEGIRAVIWTQGCSHNCSGCHNPETHSFTSGYVVDTSVIKEQIKKLTFHNGITLSGGDPLFQAEACLDIAKYAKELELDVWCYTGFTFEEIMLISKSKPIIKEFLSNIDVLVDGKFKLEEKSYDAIFRGSRNQRIIDVQKSLKIGKVVEIEKYKNDFILNISSENKVYI